MNNKFIELQRKKDFETILISVNQISSVVEFKSYANAIDFTLLSLFNGKIVEVKQSLEEIKKMIADVQASDK